MSDSRPVILQVLPRLQSGGVERGTVEITEAIRDAAMKPLVASSGGQMIPHITHAGGEHVTLPLDRKNPFIIRKNAWKLYKLIKTRDVKLVHARSRAPAWAAYYAAKWADVPFITTFHGVYSGESAMKRHYNSVMVRGERVIAVSKYVQEHIIRHYHVDPVKVRLIPRGVDLNMFDEKRVVPGRIAELVQQWRLPDDATPILFCPGRITRIKGLDILIEALARLKDLPFLCIIAGSDDGHEEYRDKLQSLIMARGLGGKVRMVNATQAMAEAYKLSSLVIVPSIKPESFGRVAIEAQAMGVCVIGTDHGGVRETILPNETGYLVPPGDDASLAEAIRFALARDEKTVAAMKEFAIQHMQRHFSVALMKKKTIDVYKELLG
jgi:glycosyltransferase involved in cell wall biosynthesis